MCLGFVLRGYDVKVGGLSYCEKHPWGRIRAQAKRISEKSQSHASLRSGVEHENGQYLSTVTAFHQLYSFIPFVFYYFFILERCSTCQGEHSGTGGYEGQAARSAGGLTVRPGVGQFPWGLRFTPWAGHPLLLALLLMAGTTRVIFSHPKFKTNRLFNQLKCRSNQQKLFNIHIYSYISYEYNYVFIFVWYILLHSYMFIISPIRSNLTHSGRNATYKKVEYLWILMIFSLNIFSKRLYSENKKKSERYIEI